MRQQEKVALVGAYERDNFGDLLLGLVTSTLLPQEVVFTAPFPGFAEALLGRSVQVYGRLFDNERFSSIWVVGGEVGSPNLRAAYRMSIPADLRERSNSSRGWRRKAYGMAGSRKIEMPYLPRPTAYRGTIGTPLVINSAGISGLTRLNRMDRAAGMEAIREADYISVRDPESSKMLRAMGVAHVVVPDIVHAIRVLQPVSPRRHHMPSAVVQIRRADIESYGVEVIAAQLADKRFRGFEIRLLAAGLAQGHDSLQHYHEIAEGVNERCPRQAITVLTERDPLRLVGEISSAAVVVGSSLHVRIVASAYGIPRVSLDNGKVNTYSDYWDSQMPFAVSPDNLGAAVEESLSPGRIRASSSGQELAEMAVRNVEALVGAISELDPSAVRDRVARRRRQLERYSRERRAATLREFPGRVRDKFHLA